MTSSSSGHVEFSVRLEQDCELDRDRTTCGVRYADTISNKLYCVAGRAPDCAGRLPFDFTTSRRMFLTKKYVNNICMTIWNMQRPE